MRSRTRRIGMTSKSLLYAIVIHLVAGVLLVLNIEWPSHVVSSPRSEPAPVQASVVSEAEIQKQMEAIKENEQAEQRKQEEAQEKLEELLEKKQQEEQRLAEIKERQEQEKQKAEELAEKKQQEQEELAKLEQQEERRKQEEAERQRQLEAERQRKAEEERKRKEEAERKRREEAERQRKAEEERKRKEAEEQRQKELAAKQEREQQLQEQLERERLQRRVQSALAQYIPIIRQKVSRNWNRPGTVRNDIEAHVTVRLSEAGEVISARIVKSSGNPVFDRSVENAVLKASPLPIPREQGVNEEFRTLRLKFKPQDMIS